MLQQAAETFAANNLAAVSIVLRYPADRHIFNPLVWSFCVIMREEFRDDAVEMLFTQHYEMIQILLLKRLDKPFDKGIHVGASGQKLMYSEALRFEDFIKLCGEFRVRVVPDVRRISFSSSR